MFECVFAVANRRTETETQSLSNLTRIAIHLKFNAIAALYSSMFKPHFGWYRVETRISQRHFTPLLYQSFKKFDVNVEMMLALIIYCIEISYRYLESVAIAFLHSPLPLAKLNFASVLLEFSLLVKFISKTMFMNEAVACAQSLRIH
jgi:hypothetical protein